MFKYLHIRLLLVARSLARLFVCSHFFHFFFQRMLPMTTSHQHFKQWQQQQQQQQQRVCGAMISFAADAAGSFIRYIQRREREREREREKNKN
jgi:hypothetical protein